MSAVSREVLSQRVEQRRTFAIISHPDAGKTTLTEKLLLFSGAIQIAGSVKARKASRHATSDWMEIEKQRGISVASSVMQMEYRDCVINLLDTPGHQDFSEDTYRVLTAVDAALMVIDAANGVEAQTLRLLQVCRARNTPIITFVNKMDREVREPLELMDEIERVLGMAVVPFTWPVGMGKSFHGVFDLREDACACSSPARTGSPDDDEIIAGHRQPALARALRRRVTSRREHDIELVRDAAPRVRRARSSSPAGRRRCSSARRSTTSACEEVLDALVDLAPPPRPRVALQRAVAARGAESSRGVVFKIQANMDPAHRDRIAFVRVCSGHFERGMRLTRARTGKEFRPNTVVTFLSQRRELLDEAYAGDIIGIPNHGVLQLGDTLTEGEALQFTGLPFFAPEMFRSVEVADPLRTKQLRTGPDAARRGGRDPGVPPVARHDAAARRGRAAAVRGGRAPARARVRRGSARDARRPTPRALGVGRRSRRSSSASSRATPAASRCDAVDAPAVLTASQARDEVVQENWPKIRFHALREHAGLVLEGLTDLPA